MNDAFVVRSGRLAIDLAHYRVLIDGESVALSYRQYALLVYLATHAGHVVSRRRLLEEGLGRHDHEGLRAVDELIRHLKAKVEQERTCVIEAVGELGYRLIPQPALAA